MTYYDVFYAITDAVGGQYYHGYGHGGVRWRWYPKLWRRRADARCALNHLLADDYYKDKRQPKLMRFLVESIEEEPCLTSLK
jgi:hypothetical protein